MKRKLISIISFVLAAGMLINTAFAQEFQVLQPDGTYETVELLDIESLNTDIYVTDSNLDAALKEAAGKSEDYIFTQSDSSLFKGKTLDLSGKNITSLEGLESFTSIECLDLSSNKITDISALDGMTSLITLDLSDNRICDLTPLESLTALTTLNLADNLIGKSGDEDTLSSISGLSKLTSLTLDNNVITDTSAIEALTSLKSLSINNCQISELGTLGSTGLQELYAKANSIDSLDGLSGLSSLTTLDVDSNALTDLYGISNLKALKNLYASYNSINDIEGIEELSALRVLALSGNGLSDIEPLGSSSANLYALYLDDNYIDSDSLEYLSGFKLMQYLYLNNNQLSTIVPLRSVGSNGYLKELNLSDNYIFDVYYSSTDVDDWDEEEDTEKSSVFKGLSGLTFLSLANNDLGANETPDLSYLSTLSKLQTLEIDGDKDIDTSALLSLKNLKTINMGVYAKNFSDESESAITAKGITIDKEALENDLLDDDLTADIVKSLESTYSAGNIYKYGTSAEKLDNKARKLTVNKDVLNVKSIKLTDSYYSYVDSLENFTNLESIEICVDTGADLDVLENLAKLTSGDIYCKTTIDDTTAQMLEEKGLTVHRGTLETTNISTDNPELETAVREFYNVPDDGVVYIDEVNYLDLSDTGITSISSIGQFPNLTTLNISENTISGLSPLSSLENLTYLYMDGVGAENLDSITGLSNLRYVSANDNSMTEGLLSEGDFSALTKLDYLSANSCDMLYLDAAATAPNLSYLYLINNNIDDVIPLLSAGDLKEVDLRLNPLDLTAESETMLAIADLQSNNVVVYTDDYEEPVPSTGILGDANGDGTVNASDALLTLQYSLNSDGVNANLENMLVTKDSTVTASNALEILQKSLNADFVFSVLK